MKIDKLHVTLGALASVLAVACIWLLSALVTSREQAQQYIAVGAYAFINGQNEVLKAIHETRVNTEQEVRYMTPEGLSAYRQSLGAPVPGAKPPAIKLPNVSRDALERVVSLAAEQSASAK
jgi:hypothetical protein